MNTAKVIGICHRIKITNADKRGPLLAELTDAIDEADGAPALTPKQLNQQAHNSSGTVENLRCMLQDPGIRDNGRAQAAIVRAIRTAQA